eukprot:9096407-Pyramimonas_sp.AAC.1
MSDWNYTDMDQLRGPIPSCSPEQTATAFGFHYRTPDNWLYYWGRAVGWTLRDSHDNKVFTPEPLT